MMAMPELSVLNEQSATYCGPGSTPRWGETMSRMLLRI